MSRDRFELWSRTGRTRIACSRHSPFRETLSYSPSDHPVQKVAGQADKDKEPDVAAGCIFYNPWHI